MLESGKHIGRRACVVVYRKLHFLQFLQAETRFLYSCGIFHVRECTEILQTGVLPPHGSGGQDMETVGH